MKITRPLGCGHQRGKEQILPWLLWKHLNCNFIRSLDFCKDLHICLIQILNFVLSHLYTMFCSRSKSKEDPTFKQKTSVVKTRKDLKNSTNLVPKPSLKQRLSGLRNTKNSTVNRQELSKTMIISQFAYLVLTDFHIFVKFIVIVLLFSVLVLGVLHYITRIVTALMGSLKWASMGNMVSLGKIIGWFI